MSKKKYVIGDCAYLKEPYLGYRYVIIIGFVPDGRLNVELSSGLVITIYPDELEDE